VIGDDDDSLEDTSKLIDQIERLVKSTSGLRNTAHSDIQVVLEIYAKDFADRYRNIMTEHSTRLLVLARDWTEKSFMVQDSCGVVTKAALESLKGQTMEIVEDIANQIGRVNS